MVRIGIVAGETSGDLLAADIIKALKETGLEIELVGIGGTKLTELGCKNLFSMDRLSVMGITEVIGRLPELLDIRRQLLNFYKMNPPDIFIGVDAPDFNFTLEKKLKKAGIKTIHVVSPSIWAWRQYRLRKIRRSVDLMLTIFPFEAALYEKHNIPVKFIGHPLAEKLNTDVNKKEARLSLNLPIDKKIIALLPGSRRDELNNLIMPFIETADWCKKNYGDIHFVVSLKNENDLDNFKNVYSKNSYDLSISFYKDSTHDVLEAADAALLASGTVALEALLRKCPMVVAYKLNWLTYQIAKMMIKIPYVSLPNILASKELVPEYLQNSCQPELMGKALIDILDNKTDIIELNRKFNCIHQSLLRPSSVKIDEVILGLINEKCK